MSAGNLAATTTRGRGRKARAPSWLRRARFVLELTQPEMAAAIGCPLRTYQRYESGETACPLELGFEVRGLLNARGLDSPWDAELRS